MKEEKGPGKPTNQITLCLIARVGYVPISGAQVNADLGLDSLKETGPESPQSHLLARGQHLP